MAVYNEILVGRVNRGLQKLFGIKGPPPVPQLSSEVMAVHRIESGVENRYLEGWNRFGVSINVAASVGNTSGFRLRNPTVSGVIAVIEKMDLIESANSQFNFSQGPTAADLVTGIGMVNGRLDPRGDPTSALSASSQNTTPAIANLTNLVYSATVLANAISQVINTPNQELPLLPGDALQWAGAAVNVTLTLNMWWRERILEDSEKA